MSHRYLLLLIAAISFSCKKGKGTIDPPSLLPPPKVPTKAFYHFEYNAGSGDFVYTIRPDAGQRFQLSSFYT